MNNLSVEKEGFFESKTFKYILYGVIIAIIIKIAADSINELFDITTDASNNVTNFKFNTMGGATKYLIYTPTVLQGQTATDRLLYVRGKIDVSGMMIDISGTNIDGSGNAVFSMSSPVVAKNTYDTLNANYSSLKTEKDSLMTTNNSLQKEKETLKNENIKMEEENIKMEEESTIKDEDIETLKQYRLYGGIALGVILCILFIVAYLALKPKSGDNY
jgi:hypothetical protein